MKKLYILVAMLLVSITALAQDGRSLYNKYSDYDNVEAVYISPAMFRLIGKIPDVEMEGENVNLGPIIKSLSGLYILSIKQGAIATLVAVGLTLTRNPEPIDTFDDPYLAYAEVEKVFAKISGTVAYGAEKVSQSEQTLDKLSYWK